MQPITGGTADDVDVSSVLVIAKGDGIDGRCSGVIVSPHVVLTAAHCVQVDAKCTVFVGADYNDRAARMRPENLVDVVERHSHPRYKASTNTHDLGVLITAMALAPPPARMNGTPLVPADRGTPIRIVGYGQTSGSSKAMGRRRQGESTLAGFDASSLVVEGVPNICLFDSGGPTFMRREDGQEAVVGIHFIIDSATCDGQGVDVRVDANVAFIDGHVAAAEVSAAAGPSSNQTAGDASTAADSAATGDSKAGCSMSERRPTSAAALLASLAAASLSVLWQRRRARQLSAPSPPPRRDDRPGRRGRRQ